MPPVIALHMTAALLAVPLGGWLLLRTKGTAAHRLAGRVYVALMLTTAITSFWITGIAGSNFSVLHILSLAALYGLGAGIVHARAGRIPRHRRAMLAVYASLLLTLGWAAMPGRTFGTMLWG
jgi:uncharacterized membrane protein